ncbi:hypothetical protein RvY_15985 [Ramazzottius varieornatus]|uniref:Myeloid leukemia factor n=1 Tax=Ramazzottius varieornatus TaxID=947166 RepID=A0A1D1VZV8_RAMVA|nr:hypothetical protein RvY_15985 [Ramazzottius varieornatus]
MNNRDFRPPFGFPGAFFDGFDSRGGNRFDDEGDDAFGDDIFGRFRFGNLRRSSPFQDMQNAFSGAEMMFRHMDRMFQDMHMFGDFGQIMGPNDAHETLAIENGNKDDKNGRRPGRTRSPRDEMLKEPDSDDITAAFPGGMEDREVKEHEVKDIILGRDGRGGGRTNSQGGFSWSGSSSMTSFAGFGDGKMEQRRTVQNPDGSKSTIVTRIMGDREITITKTISRNGEEVVEEELVNMDEDDRENFEQEWTGHGQSPQFSGLRPGRPRDERSIMSRGEPPLLDRRGPGILSKIFGSWFR